MCPGDAGAPGDSPQRCQALSELRVEPLERDRLDEAVDVLCEAFYDYPVMRFVIGPAGDDYSQKLRHLVGFLTQARFVRNDLVLGADAASELVAVANIVHPDTTASPGLEPIRELLWQELGEAARGRYESLGSAIDSFSHPDPHYHLSMIGVRPSSAGRGLARRLLEPLHELSASDPRSTGVSLNTEDPANLPLYEHFGYRIVGHARVGDIESWGLFRPD